MTMAALDRNCASLWPAVTKNRSRAARSGTAGWKIGGALMPRSSSAAASLPAPMELPVTTGTIAAPIEPPVSSPPSRSRP
jgi:hypothetical protein